MDQVDAEIAVLMREHDARHHMDNPRVARAMQNLREQQTFSRLEAADREISRAEEDEEVFLMALAALL